MPVHLSHLGWPDSARWFVLYGGVGDVPLQNLTGKARLAEFQGALPGRPTRSAFELTLLGKELAEVELVNEQPIYLLRQSTVGTVELRAFGTVVAVNMDRPGQTASDGATTGYESRWRISCSTVYRQMQNTYLPDAGYVRETEEYAADRLAWLVDGINLDTDVNISFPIELRLDPGILMLAPTDLDQKYGQNFGGSSIADAINEICAYGELEWAFDKPTLSGYGNPDGITDEMDPAWWPVLDPNPAVSTIRVWNAVDGPPSLKDDEEEPPITIFNVPGFDPVTYPHLIPAREMAISIDTDTIATQARVFYNGGSVTVDLDPEGFGVFQTRITSFDTLTPEMATSLGRTQLASRCRANQSGQAVVPYHPRWKVGYKVAYIQAHNYNAEGEYFAARSAIVRDVALQWSENDAGDPTWAVLTFGNDPYVAPTLPRPVSRADGGDSFDIPGLNDIRADLERMMDGLNIGGYGAAQIIAVFTGGGDVIPPLTFIDVPITSDMQIQGWTLLSDDTAVIDVQWCYSEDYPGSLASISSAAVVPVEATGAGTFSSSIDGWTRKNIGPSDALRFVFDSGNATAATLSLNVRRR